MAVYFESYLWDFLTLLAALTAVGYTYFWWSFQYWKRRNVPCLEPSIPWGNIESPINRTMYVGDDIKQIYSKGKAKGWKFFGIYSMAKPNLVISDVKLLKQIMTKDFNSFLDRGFYMNEKDDPISAHLFSLEGTKWKNLRAKLSPTFTSGKMKSMFSIVTGCGEVLEKYLENNIRSNEGVDIKDILMVAVTDNNYSDSEYMFSVTQTTVQIASLPVANERHYALSFSCCLGKFTTDVIGSAAFGLECNSFKDPDAAFRKAGKRFVEATTLDVLKVAFANSFPDLSRALRIAITPKEVADFMRTAVRDTVTYRQRNKVTRNDFLQLLIDIMDDSADRKDGSEGDGRALTMDEVAAQCFIFFVAGFETSSTTMTFVLYHLALHQDVQDRVREEIKTVLAKYEGKVTYESLNEMKYMKEVIDETLRLWPPLPFITRVATEDYKIPDEDVVIKKGTSILISLRGIHYDEEYFENPTVFNPERFSEENRAKIPHYAHIPFGEGPRVCIGERFGVIQTKVGLASILKNYRVIFNNKTETPLQLSKESFVPAAETGIWVNLQKL